METESLLKKEDDSMITAESSTITPSTFCIFIKYINSDGTIDGMRNIQIQVKRTDLIAEVKQKYIDSGLCISPDYIVLYHNGNELSDYTTVMENDLRENSTVFHKYTNINPYSKVNYGELAKLIKTEAIKNKDYHHAGFDPVYGVWDQQWDKGDEWKSYPTVMVPDQEKIKNQSAIIPKSRPFNPQTGEYTERLFKSMYVSLVGGFYFEVIHRMEGKWSGTSMLSLPTSFSNENLTTSDLKYDPHGFWVETRNNVNYNGVVTTRTLRYIPVGNGHLRVEMSNAMYADCKVEMIESSPYLLIITAVDKYSGKPKLVETFTILDNMHRIHTIQDFSAGDNLADIYVMKEERIVDPTASSLAPYSDLNSRPDMIYSVYFKPETNQIMHFLMFTLYIVH